MYESELSYRSRNLNNIKSNGKTRSLTTSVSPLHLTPHLPKVGQDHRIQFSH